MIMPIIEGFFSIITSLISFLPVLNIDPTIIQGANTFISTLNSINMILPVNTILIALGVIIAYHSFTLIFYVLNWVIRKIPTVS